MKAWIIGAVVAFFAIVTVPSAAAESRGSWADQVVDCNLSAPFPNIVVSSARGITCRQAAREIRRYRGSIRRTFRTPGGFRCTRVSGGALGGQWRCVRAVQAFRFEFGD
jgi:hypothetical protein